MELKFSDETIEKIKQQFFKLWDCIREAFYKMMKPIVNWVKNNYDKVEQVLSKYKRYLKYQKRVNNRKKLYMERKRIYGK